MPIPSRTHPDPTAAADAIQKGDLAWMSGHREEARRCYQLALEAVPDTAEGRLTLARALAEDSPDDPARARAIQLFDEALERLPDGSRQHAEVRLERLRLLAGTPPQGQASPLELAQEATQLGLVLEQQGLWLEASEAYESAGDAYRLAHGVNPQPLSINQAVLAYQDALSACTEGGLVRGHPRFNGLAQKLESVTPATANPTQPRLQADR